MTYILFLQITMTFSFNFQVEDSGVSNGTTPSGSSETKNSVTWKEAKEHFIDATHREKVTIANVQNFESFLVSSGTEGEEEERVEVLSSDSVALRLSHCGYSGDLDPALQHNTDLVPGLYEVGQHLACRYFK